MHERTLLEQAQALQDGEVSSVELTQFYLNRIQAHDESLNSFVTVTGRRLWRRPRRRIAPGPPVKPDR